MHLRIEITEFDPPVGETTVDETGLRFRFNGWLELIASVERVVQAARAEVPRDSNEPRG